MKAIKSTVFIALLFASVTIHAQTDSTHSKKEDRYFKKFQVEVGGGSSRFIGKKDPEVKHSKEGINLHILPSWNITDNHSVGLKMVGSYHDEEKLPDHFSLLANYQFTYYGGPSDLPVKDENRVGLYAGLGIGFSNTVAQKDSISETPSKTSFAMMPYLGIRRWHLYADVHYHFEQGNKQGTY